MRKKIILVTGGFPPPVGGVTVFIKYLFGAFKCNGNVIPLHFSFFNLLFKRFDVVLINASNPLKRLGFILLARIFLKKAFFIKHGDILDLDSYIIRYSLFLCHGVFCLNHKVKNQLDGCNINSTLITTVFRENLNIISSKKFSNTDNGIADNTEKCKILLYINNNQFVNGQEVYGADFILSCLPQLANDFLLFVIDLSKSYREYFNSFSNVIYYDEPQDFSTMLRSVDIYIRPTSTDGMSVALLEAGVIGVKCLASDAVPRPSFVCQYKHNSHSDFILKLNELSKTELIHFDKNELNSINDVERFILLP